ncbi:MAG TPA: tRNA 2-selenouridine(34) synthase MnmH [Chitinophagaceae bacterium]|jgi:tRNA 2-selenouridine synthase|nr:tRNA 2-selenouridine(34) synthase MnmH [Chitinophagaceae bacterium]
MAINRVDIETFLQLTETHPVFDVRSEGEYAHARMPGALSLPLFSNEERKVIGTQYKQESVQQAIKTGLRYFGPKLVPMVEVVERMVEERGSGKEVAVYCWRGGMRSGAVAWLLDLYGFQVHTLAGGYKAFRRWALKQFGREYPLQLLSGYTGSGKTETLLQWQREGRLVIDLEGLAGHKGSAFGNIGLPPQPSQEQFENSLAMELRKVMARCGPGDSIWVEDESQRLGTVNLPLTFYRHMRTRPVHFREVSFEERLQRIVSEYGKAETERLIHAILRIRKRLGGLDAKNAVNHLMEGQIEDCFRILLRYYDKQYDRCAVVNRSMGESVREWEGR